MRHGAQKKLCSSTSSGTATSTAQTAQNISAGHVYHGQIKKTETTANDAIEMNKKERASSAVTLRSTSTSSQKPFATADSTSDEESAAADADERNSQTKFDRKRKASTDEDEELPTKKAAVNKYKKICSTNGCTHVAVQGGVCMRHGGQGGNYAAAKNVRIKLSKEECVQGMEHRSHANDAAGKNALNKPKKEECA